MSGHGRDGTQTGGRTFALCSERDRRHIEAGGQPDIKDSKTDSGSKVAQSEEESKESLFVADVNHKPCSISKQKEDHSSEARPAVDSAHASRANDEIQAGEKRKESLSVADVNRKPSSKSEQKEHHSPGARPAVDSAHEPRAKDEIQAGEKRKESLSVADVNRKPCSKSEQKEHHSCGARPAADSAHASRANDENKADEKRKESRPFDVESALPKEFLLSRMRAVLYGNCIGDAIGLLTEFMTKDEAHQVYENRRHRLEYYMKHDDFHRNRWSTGDWTDDSDQMILILRTLYENHGEANILDFAAKFRVWTETGYEELGDIGGYGIGQTTYRVMTKRDFLTDPHKCAREVWEYSGKWAAPNGGVMRTSVLGIQDFSDMTKVIENTKQICMVTHTDPRCVASCIAVTTAIALMLQGKHCSGNDWEYDVRAVTEEVFEYACDVLETEEQKDELRTSMFAKSLSELDLSGENIGYTYKCLGAGFWAYRQEDFKAALTELVMEAGDADTNGAVAGALLGCKLGVEKLPLPWLEDLLHKKWLDEQIDRYINMVGLSV